MLASSDTTEAYNPPMPDAFLDHSAAHASLAFEGICRNFGRLRVLRDLSGNVESRELFLISGSNGSGKSTLLRCLAGLMAPQRGTITCSLDGKLLDVGERRHAIGFVSPDLELYPELSTRENLEFFCRLRGIETQRSRDLLAEVGLPENRAAGALSSGMTQRLRWAWALLHRPSILLLDEPLQNLDAQGRADVLRLLRRHLETGLAVVANPDPLELPHVATHLHLDG